MPRRAALTGDIARLQELPVALSQVLQERQADAGEDAARTEAGHGRESVLEQ